MQELAQALTYSQCCDECRWQFAVEIDQLQRLGLTNSDLRVLCANDMLQHGHETTGDDSASREFTAHGSRRFTSRSCFVLTDEGCEAWRDANYDQQATGNQNSPTTNGASRQEDSSISAPIWDVEKRELTLGGVVVKRFRCPAVNQETILAVFQELGWPTRIDDPLPPSLNHDPKRRLQDTVKSLNRNQLCGLMRFGGDGTGEGVIWERADSL